MKYLQAIIVIMLFSFTLSAQNSRVSVGVDATHYSDMFTNVFFNPSLAVETSLGEKWSLNVEMSFGQSSEFKEVGVEFIVKDVMVHPEIRYYTKGGLSGLYFGAGMAYTKFKAFTKQEGERIGYPLKEDLVATFSWLGTVGWQANLTEKLTLNADFHIGIGSSKGNGIRGLGLGVGYKF